MARFRVLVRPRPSARLVSALETDSFDEAEEFAVSLNSHEVWVGDSKNSANAYEVRGGKLVAHRVPSLPPSARAEVDEVYLQTRADLAGSGLSRAEIDAIMPLDDEGDVPWVSTTLHQVLAAARPQEND
jgi:hypothetical protein